MKKRYGKLARGFTLFLAVIFLMESMLVVRAAGPEITAPSAIVVEASTGQIIYEKNADEKRSPAAPARPKMLSFNPCSTISGNKVKI